MSLRGQTMTRRGLSIVALLIVVLTGSALVMSSARAAASADTPAVNVVPPTDPRAAIVPPNDPRVMHPLPNDPRVLGPRTDIPLPQPHQHRRFDGQPVIVAPPPLYVVGPAGGSSTDSCIAPGYWTYQWVPQVYTQSTWVPGQWSPDGTWIDGYYEPRSLSTGSYQPLWVPSRRIC
jgi:hypothetical protein